MRCLKETIVTREKSNVTIRVKRISLPLQTLFWLISKGGEGMGTEGSEPPTSLTLLSHYPYLYLTAHAIFPPAPIPCNLEDSRHNLVIFSIATGEQLLGISDIDLGYLNGLVQNHAKWRFCVKFLFSQKCLNFCMWSSITAPFNNMRTLKFKVQPTNAFFATVS